MSLLHWENDIYLILTSEATFYRTLLASDVKQSERSVSCKITVSKLIHVQMHVGNSPAAVSRRPLVGEYSTCLDGSDQKATRFYPVADLAGNGPGIVS